MICVGVSGKKKTGKSTLCRALIERIAAAGFSVGYIKRTSEELEGDEATDTGRARSLGVATLLWGPNGVRYEEAISGETTPQRLAAQHFPTSDIVLMEGGKDIALPKIWTLAEGEEPAPHAGAFAFWSMRGARDGVYGPDGADELASKIIDMYERADDRTLLTVDGGIVPMKSFVAEFVEGGVRGMVSSLKKAEAAGEAEVRVYIKSKKINK